MDHTEVLSEVLHENTTSLKDIIPKLFDGLKLSEKMKELLDANIILKELDYVSKRVQDAPMLNVAELCKPLSDKTKECLTLDECWTKSEVMKEIHQQKVKLAQRVIQHGAIWSAGTILLQAKAMVDVWSVIKDAKNISDESKAEVEILKERMKILTELSAELTLLVSNYESNNGMEEREAKKLFRKITNKKNRLQMLFVDVNRKTCDLKVSVNGQKHSLMSAQKEAARSCIISACNTGEKLIQYFLCKNDISATMNVLHIGITGLFSLMTVANVKLYHMSEEMLKDIGGTLQQINELSKQLVAIENLLLETADWLEENGEEL